MPAKTKVTRKDNAEKVVTKVKKYKGSAGNGVGKVKPKKKMTY